MNININRLNIALHGVSTDIVQEAINNLDTELKRRLGVLNIGQGLTTRSALNDIGELALGPLHSNVTLDANSLRGLIAERLIETLDKGVQ